MLNTKEKIERLKSEIEYMEASLESAESHPTETAQFYSAMANQRAELQTKKQQLESLKKLPDEIQEKEYARRTNQQNKALHVLFALLAQKLNENGLDMKKTFARRPEMEIPWTGASIKEYIWRPAQKGQLNKSSTTQLTTVEIDQVFDTINKFFGENFGLHVPFPSIDEILLKMRDPEGTKL